MLKHGYFLILSTLCWTVILGNEESQEPSVTVTPFYHKIYGQKNSRLVVDCYVNSKSPVFEYSWFKDGEKLLSKKRVYTASNGSLIFSKLVSKTYKSDTGHYDCYATNEFGTVIGAQVDILIEKQSILLEPKNVEVKVGGVARFHCTLTPSSSSLLYLWAFEDVDLNTAAHKDRIFIQDGVLQIYNVTWADEGLYYCTAFKHGDNMDLFEESAFLKIKSGPLTKESRLLNTLQNITVIDQEPALLECLIQGQEPVIISWRYPNGSTVVPNEHVRISGASNLLIAKTNPKDEGQYECVVTHRNGSDTKHIYTLSIHVTPEFTESPPLVQQNVIAQVARLPCAVTGNPEPERIWYKDGLRIFPSPGMKIENELVLHGRYEDRGYYQCVANNSVRTVIATAWIDFKRKAATPGVVKDLIATPLSPFNVSLLWPPAETHEAFPVMAYVVHYHELHDVECPGPCKFLYERQREVSEKTSLVIKGLKPYTQYSFDVQGFSLNGAGVLSKSVVVRTLQSVPSAAPDFQISPDSPTSFRISWAELPKSQKNGVISQYKVSIEAGIKRHVIKLPGDTREHLVTGLEEGKQYKIQVLAGTSVGFPNINDNWILYSTPHVESGDLPTPMVNFTSINATSVLVTWHVDRNSNIGSYRIVVRELIENVPVGEYNLSGTASECIITGLENRTFYEVDFMVKSRTSNAMKTVKEVFQSLSPDDFPEPPPPIIVKPEAFSSTQIKLVWEKPKSSVSIVKYTIRYQQRTGEEMMNRNELSKSFGTERLSTVINELQPYTWYFISVKSHTENIGGPYSRPVIAQTLEGIPSPPENVLAEVVSPGKVKLKWGPPSKQNGVITYYIIYYNSDKNVPDNSWTSIQQNGSTTSAVVKDLTNKVYYFKLRACTNAGESQSTDIIEINTLNCIGDNCPLCQPPKSCVKSDDREKLTVLFEQRLGIVIGCAVGLVCIVICSVFVIVRHRQLRARYRQHANVHLINTSTGQNVGVYLSEQPVGHAVNRYSPILRHVPENEASDSKGGDSFIDRRLGRGLPHNGSARMYSRGHQDTEAEQRALLSAGTGSSSQSNETSEDMTPDAGTLDTSSSSSLGANYEISYNKIKDFSPLEGAVNEGGTSVSKEHLDQDVIGVNDSIVGLEDDQLEDVSDARMASRDSDSDVSFNATDRSFKCEIPPKHQQI